MLVLAMLLLPAISVTALAPMLTVTVPLPRILMIGTFQVILSTELGLPTVAPKAAVVSVMSAALNVVGSIGSLKTTVKFTGLAFVGSCCAIS